MNVNEHPLMIAFRGGKVDDFPAVVEGDAPASVKARVLSLAANRCQVLKQDGEAKAHRERAKELFWLSIKHGSEGPAHDPYGYVEYTICRGEPYKKSERFDTLHAGLGVFWQTKHPDGRTERRDPYGEGEADAAEAAMIEAFSQECADGMDLGDLDRYDEEDRHPEICPGCGRPADYEEADGHPGETMTLCVHPDCRQVVDSDVNWAAIE